VMATSSNFYRRFPLIEHRFLRKSNSPRCIRLAVNIHVTNMAPFQT